MFAIIAAILFGLALLLELTSVAFVAPSALDAGLAQVDKYEIGYRFH